VTRRVDPQRGAAMAVTLILTTALLGAGALAIYLQLSDTKAAQQITQSRSSLFCAEAGLVASRSYIVAHATDWPAMLDSDDSNDPDGYPITGDIDGDGTDDYSVTIRDNDDELSPNDNDSTLDIDGTIFVISKCLMNADTSKEIMEMVSFGGGGTNYRNQMGQGAGGTNNVN